MDTHSHLEHAYDSVLDSTRKQETLTCLRGALVCCDHAGARYYIDSAIEQVEIGSKRDARHYIMTAAQLLSERTCRTCGSVTMATGVTA